MRRFTYGKFGLKVNPVGAQVALMWQGRKLLGDVIGFERNETRGVTLLSVRHFNGEMWPIKPCAAVVEVLERVNA